MSEEKRKLTPEEIDDVLSVIVPLHSLRFYTDLVVIENIKNSTRKQLVDIQMYPSAIPKLKQIIKSQYIKACVSPGEMVGCTAASSIGEQFTQSSLNSVVGETIVRIRVKNEIIEAPIGKFIDDTLGDDYSVVEYLGENSTQSKAYAHVCNISSDTCIESVDQYGNVSWSRITKLIRHPLYTKLIKVTTATGRSVIATTGLSFLKYTIEGLIEPIRGADLKVGNYIPVAFENNSKIAVRDKVVRIENIDTSDVKYVYDFEVPSTGNFAIANGIQMRDSFHSSGSSKAHLTTGLGRVNELLNATKNLKTPSLTIYFTEDVKGLRMVRRICQKYIIWQTIKSLIKDYSIEESPNVDKDRFYHMSTGFISESWTQCRWRIRFIFDVYKLWVCGKTLMHVCKAITACVDTSVLHFVTSHDAQGIVDVWVSEVNLPINHLVNFKNTEPHKVAILENWLASGQGSMYYYTTNVVLPTLLSVPVSGICGVQDCYYSEDENHPGVWYVDTKGGSLKSLYSLNCIDHLRCRTNSMWETFNMFGIEAAKVFLKEEFTKLISASKRHLELLISTMTVSGRITAVSRYGIDRNEVGAISKAAFEQPVENFLISATRGECDKINSVSASVTVAKLARIGTNMFDVISDTEERKIDYPDFSNPCLDTIEEDSGDIDF